jgi:MOSC domain-containing protein YiiM
MNPVAANAHLGQLIWLGVRPASREPMQSLWELEARAGLGLTGDRYAKAQGARQVTLMQWEDLAWVSAQLGRVVQPEDLRRNLLITGIALSRLAQGRFWIGPVLFEATGPCDPCYKMDQRLGPGGCQALQGSGGLCARVLGSGRLRQGDLVWPE